VAVATRALLRRIAILAGCVWGLGLVLPSPQRLQAGSEKKKPITARLEATDSLFPAGGPVCVRLILESTSTRPLLLPKGFSIQNRLDYSNLPEFPDVVVVPSLKGPGGDVKLPEPQALLATRGFGRDDFGMLAPGSSRRMTWNVTHWPWYLSFPREGTFTLRLRLHFFVAKWLRQQQAERSWLVPAETLAFVRGHSENLYEGYLDTNPVTVRICSPGPGKNCPKVRKVKPSDPNQVCFQK
jgi:hypothetical protein